jgi:hypothetical protein
MVDYKGGIIMLHELDKGTRSFIEGEALKLQTILKIKNEPNVYEYSTINDFFRRKKWRFKFNVKLKETENSMKDMSIEDTMEQMVKYNVINGKDSKILQFDISDPHNLDNVVVYMMFLRALFYEYWGELKKNTGYKDIIFEDNSDFNLFSRAMIIPHKKFKDFFAGISNRSSELKISDIADKFSVLYSVIEDRIDDYGWIAN